MRFYIDSMEKTHTKKNRREDHGGWRRAHCRNAHVLHCLLKIILSADLLPFLKLGSITNSHTNNPNSERGNKTGPKPWKKHKKVSPHVTCPASPQTLSMGRNLLFFLFFWFSRGFCHLDPKMHQNLWKNKKNKKKVSPHVTCPASPQTVSMGRNFLFFLFFWFSRGCCNCVSPNNISCSFFVFFVFLFLGFLGEILTLTNIHWHSFHPSTFYIDVFIELLILATEPSEKMHGKNSSTLSPTSSGTPLDWCFIGMPRFWFLMFRGLARVLQTWNH